MYRLALTQFPTAVKFWREWLEHELRLGKCTLPALDIDDALLPMMTRTRHMYVHTCLSLCLLYCMHTHPTSTHTPYHKTGHVTEADALFRRCLLEVPHVDLFLLYLQRIRRANPAALGDGCVR